MELLTIGVLAIVLLSALLTVRHILAKKISLKYIPGPPTSWLYGERHLSYDDSEAYHGLLGNTISFFYQDSVGDMDFGFLKQYGTAWLMSLPFGVSV